MKTPAALILLVVLFLAFICTGCERRLTHEVTRPDGTRERLEYVNRGMDTKAGRLSASKDGDKLHLDAENLDAQSRAWQSLDRAVERIPIPK